MEDNELRLHRIRIGQAEQVIMNLQKRIELLEDQLPDHIGNCSTAHKS